MMSKYAKGFTFWGTSGPGRSIGVPGPAGDSRPPEPLPFLQKNPPMNWPVRTLLVNTVNHLVPNATERHS